MKLKNTRCMQYIAAITGATTIASAALYASWPSPILPKIASGDSPLGIITQEESSWIVSSFLLGNIPGSILSRWTLDRFGRKGSLLISGVPILLAWYLIAFSKRVWIICIARFIAGIAIANGESSVVLYNGEISEKEIRGRLGSMFNMLGLTGEAIVLCMGPYVSYKVLTLTSSVVPLAFLIVFYFMPESPYYLIKAGKEDEAKKHLKTLLSNDTTDFAFDEQMRTIKDTVNQEMNNSSSWWKFVLQKEYRKSLVIALGVHTISQLSGFIAIASYLQTIMAYSKDTISPEVSSVICGIIQLPVVFIAAAIMDKVGRRHLLIISLLGCALALFAESMYFYLQNVVKVDISYLSWIPTAGVLLYIVMRPIGIGTVPFVLVGELFTTNIKAHAAATSTFYRCSLAFIVAKTFEPVSNAWGIHVMFGFYTIICILGAIFVYFVVPETMGKTFAEIQMELNNEKKKNANEKFYNTYL